MLVNQPTQILSRRLVFGRRSLDLILTAGNKAIKASTAWKQVSPLSTFTHQLFINVRFSLLSLFLSLFPFSLLLSIPLLQTDHKPPSSIRQVKPPKEIPCHSLSSMIFRPTSRTTWRNLSPSSSKSKLWSTRPKCVELEQREVTIRDNFEVRHLYNIVLSWHKSLRLQPPYWGPFERVVCMCKSEEWLVVAEHCLFFALPFFLLVEVWLLGVCVYVF